MSWQEEKGGGRRGKRENKRRERRKERRKERGESNTCEDLYDKQPTVAYLSKLVEGTVLLCDVVLLQVHDGITVVHAPEESRPTMRDKRSLCHTTDPPWQPTQVANDKSLHALWKCLPLT